jgi:hypothetical protein
VDGIGLLEFALGQVGVQLSEPLGELTQTLLGVLTLGAQT